MSDFFKLFINSAYKNKSELQKEIQRVIRAKIANVVEEALHDTRSESEKIPPRDNISYAKQHDRTTLTADEIAYPPETPDDSCAITEKIREMRKLGQTFYHGYMMRQCAEVSIVKQGEFMADVTDDFTRSVYCGTERPVYGALSLEQLRTYFTWRTDVRRGVFNKTDKSYVILYCYELMNKIGVLSSQDAFNRLICVWENCRSFCPYLDGIMPVWLRDMYAYNNIDGDFSVYEEAFPVHPEGSDPTIAELLSGNYHDKLEYLISCSSYNLRGSIFYTDDTVPLLQGAAEAALTSLDEYFRQHGIVLSELICGKTRKDHSWEPFYAAFVDRDRMDGFRACRISASERYCTKRGLPCFERFEPAPYRSFIGFILKSVESVLRVRTGFRYSISANLTPVLDEFTNRDKLFAAASTPEFAALIPDAVNTWCDKNGIHPPKKEKKRKSKYDVEYGVVSEHTAAPAPQKIEIDLAALSQIRKEAEDTARKLIIEEYEDALPEQTIEEITSRVIDEVFEAQTEQASADIRALHDFSALPDGWRQFAEALDAQALELLGALSRGTAQELCRSRGTLPETEFDELNAIALEHTGDCVVENGELVPDYAADVDAILALCNN